MRSASVGGSPPGSSKRKRGTQRADKDDMNMPLRGRSVDATHLHFIYLFHMFLWLTVCLVLYFDGSLRTPRDAGFPTHGLGRMASCGAAVVSHDDYSLLSLGGRCLDIVPGITSADVEYDGLLFGLKHVVIDNDNSLVVRGDCKAIMDQLNGNAVPRKLRPKHELVMELLKKVDKISFQHVPREENKLCDSLCAGVMQIMEQREVAAFCTEMACLRQFAETETKRNVVQNELTDLLKQFLSSDKSLVRYSMRPRLYKEAISIAERLNDSMALEHVGRQMVAESKLWPPSGEINQKVMTAQGILWQVQGLELLGNEKQAKRLLQKHRYVLDCFTNLGNIIDAFDAGGDSENAIDDASFVCSEHDGKELDALQTWSNQGFTQNDQVLYEGYWIEIER